MQSLFFVRHGESQANKDLVVAGQMDVELTEDGETQARKAGEWAKAQGITFDLLISSPLQRAAATAKIIAGVIGYPESDIRYSDDLRERMCGDFEGKAVSDYYETPEAVAIHEHGVESLESLNERASRILGFIAENYPDKSVLLVSHSGIGKMLRIAVEGRDYQELDKTLSIPNATITRLL